MLYLPIARHPVTLVEQDTVWYFNLQNKPEAKIEVGDKAFKVKANITDGEERTRLYEKFKATSSNFVLKCRYQSDTQENLSNV